MWVAVGICRLAALKLKVRVRLGILPDLNLNWNRDLQSSPKQTLSICLFSRQNTLPCKSLKANWPHPRNYPHMPTNYRQTHYGVMTPIPNIKVVGQSDGRHQVHYCPGFVVDKNRLANQWICCNCCSNTKSHSWSFLVSLIRPVWRSALISLATVCWSILHFISSLSIIHFI